jgi:hypothetical protein
MPVAGCIRRAIPAARKHPAAIAVNADVTFDDFLIIVIIVVIVAIICMVSLTWYIDP